MKKLLIALAGFAVMSFGSIALADEIQGPVVMTDAQMDNVVAAGPGKAWGTADKVYTEGLVWNYPYSPNINNYRVADKTTSRPINNHRSVQNRNAIFSTEG